MNPITKALNKARDVGSNVIANRIMLQPSLDMEKARQTDAKIQRIKRRRESIKNDKAMNL